MAEEYKNYCGEGRIKWLKNGETVTPHVAERREQVEQDGVLRQAAIADFGIT